MLQRGRPDRVDSALSPIQIVHRLSPRKQKLEQSIQIVFGGRGKADLKAHRASCLRLVSSFACSLATTSTAGTDMPVLS
jgi:hypothetical protein